MHDVHGWVERVGRRRRRMEVRVHECADDRERSSRRGRTNKQQEGEQKIKMLASGDKGAIEEEVLRFCTGRGLRVHSNEGERKGRRNMKGRSQKIRERGQRREKRRRDSEVWLFSGAASEQHRGGWRAKTF